MTDAQVLYAWVGVCYIITLVAVTFMFWYTHGGKDKW